MEDMDNTEDLAVHLCEKDAGPPSHKRLKPNEEMADELSATAGGSENDGVAQSCIILTPRSDKPGGSYESGWLSFSQSASQEHEVHVGNALQESVILSGPKSGCAEEGPAQNCKQANPASLVTVGELARLPPTHQKPESANQDSLDETGLPHQCHHQSPAGSALEAGYILHCLQSETLSADVFALQRNSPECIPAVRMPSHEAECGENSPETLAEVGKDEAENVDGEAGLESDAEEDAYLWATETGVPVSGREESFTADVVQYAYDSSPIAVVSGGNSENNGRESHTDPELGFPGGNPELVAPEHSYFLPAAARTSSACTERATAEGLVLSASQEPGDVIYAAAVRHTCLGEAGGTRVERTNSAASGRRYTPGVAADEGSRRPDGRAPRETDTGGCREGGVKTAPGTACEEWLREGRDKIPEEPIKLAPSSEVIPAINRIYKLYAPPLDGEFLHSLRGDASVELTDPGEEFTRETGVEGGPVDFNGNIHAGPQPAERHCSAGEEQGRHDHEVLRHEGYLCVSSLRAGTTEDSRARSQTQVCESDAAHCRCEVGDLASPAHSNSCYQIGTVDAVSPTGENTVVSAQAEERDSTAFVVRLPVSPAKAESAVEEKGNGLAAGRGDATTEKDVSECERGPPSSLSPRTALALGLVEESISLKHHRSDVTHLAASPVKPPGDAVVPETDAGYGADALRVRPETKAQFPVRCHSDCSPAVFDSFEKIPLLPSANELENSLLDCSPRNPIRGKPQSYYDVDGPLSEITPMQIRHQPSSGQYENHTQLAESEQECSPSQKGSVPDCGSHFDFGGGGSHRESQSAYLCGIAEVNTIPDVCFSQCPPGVDPEQSDQSPTASGAREQFCHLLESTPGVFDGEGRPQTCPQPAHVWPQTSASTPAGSQSDDAPPFEMKEKFDLVLKELNLFFSIGAEAERPAGSGTPCAGGVRPEDVTAERETGCAAGPAAEAQGRTEVKQAVRIDIRADRQQLAAGRGDATTENDVSEGERGPPSSLSPRTALALGLVEESLSLKHHRSDVTHLSASPVKPPCDAVVPETDAGYGADALRVRPETEAQFPVRCHSDCSPAVFDSFEKIPLLPTADELEHDLLLDCSPRNPIRGRPQSYYDVDGPSSEITPMQIQHQPSSGQYESDTQLAESKRDVHHSPSQKESVSDFGSHFDFGGGGSHRESQSSYLCGIAEVNKSPNVCFSHCPPGVDPEQSDQSPTTYRASASGAREQFCHLLESTPGVFDGEGRPQTCPQPAHVWPQTSASTPAGSQSDDAPPFEMKEKFDLVLKELNLFFSIGAEAERPAGSGTPCAGGVRPEDVTAERETGCAAGPAAEAQGRTEVKQAVRIDIRADRQQPETPRSSGGFECEQEVPLGRCLGHASAAEGEDSMYSAVKQKERIGIEDGSKQWLPAFMVLPFLNEQNRARRLEPLKTCSRPIRVGLSKRARPKQLHPYFK